MNKKVFGGIFGVSILVLLLSMSLVVGVLYNYFMDRHYAQIKAEAWYIAEGVTDSGIEYLIDIDENKELDNRYTWIDSAGNVLFDSKQEVSQLENHSQREEFIEAVKYGEGSSNRYSASASLQTSYYAVKLEDGTVVRIGIEGDPIFLLLAELIKPAIAIIITSIIVSILMAVSISRSLLNPLNEIDLDKPMEADVYEEIEPFLKRIDNQNTLIREQMNQLRRKQNEFNTIVENMAEGFIMIDDKTHVLSYNASALKVFHAEGDPVGHDILEISRNESLRAVVDAGLEGRYEEQLMELQDRVYSVITSPVFSSSDPDRVRGVVIFIMDVTEKEAREKLRREFTANVSHELKTPLTSIMGFAEIMKSGMVKPEDMNRFSENIHKEAQRLLALIGDIIRISQLEEGKSDVTVASMDLLAVAETVVSRLRNVAEKNSITINVDGESVKHEVIPQVLDEVIYNLVENAIKYNKPQGSVSVTVGRENGAPYISVKDNGLGISEEDQIRIFERFYRVDKAHTRAIGGTGLGLSIVKHGVKLLNADIQVDSKLGAGTEMKVIF